MIFTHTVFPLALTAVLALSARAGEPQPVRLIFDTGMMGDVDDMGTAAVLHALADRGEVEILAMGLSGKKPPSSTPPAASTAAWPTSGTSSAPATSTSTPTARTPGAPRPTKTTPTSSVRWTPKRSPA